MDNTEKQREEVPNQIQLFKPGTNRTLKGDFEYDITMAEAILQNQLEKDARKGRLPIDVAHMSLSEGTNNPDGHVAVGWFDLRVDNTGIWADNISWTNKGKTFLEEKEFGWFSPAFYFDEDNKITQIINNSLTNEPASLDIQPIMQLGNTDQTRQVCFLSTFIPLSTTNTPIMKNSKPTTEEKNMVVLESDAEYDPEEKRRDFIDVEEYDEGRSSEKAKEEGEKEDKDEKDLEIDRLTAELEAQIERNAELQAQLDEIQKEAFVADIQDEAEKEILKRLDIGSLKALSKIRGEKAKQTEILAKSPNTSVPKAVALSKVTPKVDSESKEAPKYKYFKGQIPTREQLMKQAEAYRASKK